MKCPQFLDLHKSLNPIRYNPPSSLINVTSPLRHYPDVMSILAGTAPIVFHVYSAHCYLLDIHLELFPHEFLVIF